MLITRTTQGPKNHYSKYPIPGLNEPQKETLEDKVTLTLSGALPLVGAGMNLAYGGMIAGLSQSPKLGAVALLGTAANLASLPLLGHGQYLGALGLMGVSAASLNYLHNSW